MELSWAMSQSLALTKRAGEKKGSNPPSTIAPWLTKENTFSFLFFWHLESDKRNFERGNDFSLSCFTCKFC